MGPLKQSTVNTRYFVDPSGNAVFLAGTHTWNDFQDTDTNVGSIPGAFDFTGYVNFLKAHNHNATILWHKDLPEYCGWNFSGSTWRMTPWPWLRPGPGVATDGNPKFDLTQFNQPYFDRLRAEHNNDPRLHHFLGVNYDTCHFAVEFEEAAEAIARRGAQWLVDAYVNPAKAANAVAMLTARRNQSGGTLDPIELYLDGIIIYGTPERVFDQLQQLQEEIWLDYLLCAPLSHASFLLFTEKVLPRLL